MSTLQNHWQIDWAQIRDLFPATKKHIYLNGAAASPISDPAARAGTRYYHEMLHDGDMPWDTWLKEVEATRYKLAEWINAQPEEVAFTYSTSHGVNLIAQLLQRCGSVATLDEEFPTSSLPWLQQGYEVTFCRTRENGTISRDALSSALTERTRIFVCSYVQFATGFKHDLVELRSICDEKHLILIVDATQGLGAFPLDVKATGADFVLFSGYKWLMAGYGIAGLYVHPRFLNASAFPVAGWMSVQEPEEMINDRLMLKESAAALEVGSPHFAGIFALGAALDVLQGIGKQNIEQRMYELTDYLHEKLDQHHFPIVSNREPRHRSGITIVDVPNTSVVVSELAKRNVFVSARRRGLRVSLHIYNSFDDIDRFVRELSAITY